jgi:hypothetical protein
MLGLGITAPFPFPIKFYNSSVKESPHKFHREF